MTPTAIHQIQQFPAGTPLECIEGTITKVWPDRSTGTNAKGTWSFQKVDFRGTDGHEIKLKFADFVPIKEDWRGHPLRISGQGKALTVEEYQGKKSLKVKVSANLEWNPPDMAPVPAKHAPPTSHQQSAPAQQHGPPPSQHSGPPAQGPPAQRQSAPAHQPAPHQNPTNTGKIPIHGATVGMAVKLAGDIMLADMPNWPTPLHPDFSMCLFQIASDIIRVSQRLESGTLAKPASVRWAKETAPAYEPDPEHLPPPNAAQSGQGPSRGYAPEHEPDPSAARYGGTAGPGIPDDADEIPF